MQRATVLYMPEKHTIDPVDNHPFDGLLLLSFGGPEGHEDVRPFLENVTRGRGIPPERLDEVEEHYHHFGGVSPLNSLNREIIDHIEQELHTRGRDLPVFFGNRNWHPFAEDTVEQMVAAGHRRIAVFATSAWGGYSGCRQYHEDIARCMQHLEQRGLAEGVQMVKLRQFFDHPRYIDAMVDAVHEALAKVRAHGRGDRIRLVFTAHSIPLSADRSSGVDSDGALYSSQIRYASELVAQRCGFSPIDDAASAVGAHAADGFYDVVWQSRSGPEHVPWLDPDVVDHIAAIHGDVDAAIVCPIGFVSDHIEVVWDLDSELQQEAADFDIDIVRTRTAGPTADFAAMVVDLLEELESGAPVARVDSTRPGGASDVPGGVPALRGCRANGEPCAQGCCAPRKRPAAHGGARPGA